MRFFSQIILIFVLSIVISCNRNNEILSYNIGGIAFQLPSEYNVQLFDTLDNQWLIKRGKNNVLIIYAGNAIRKDNSEEVIDKKYSVLIDTISGYKRKILFYKQEICSELYMEIGKGFKSKVSPFYDQYFSEHNNDLPNIDTTTLIGEIKMNKHRKDKELAETANNNAKRDSINYEFIFLATSSSNSYCMRIEERDIDTLVKYFKQAKIILQSQ